LSKIYRDKQINLVCDIPVGAMFRGDETDLMEMLGNLLDNACKACRHQVKLNIQMKPLMIEVHDDGPGVPENKKTELLGRGIRLDTYQDGHGVGLSIVDELCHSYEGELSIGVSPLGGAIFRLLFPQHQY
jgi:two-component system sensor histidine kinase PhoQ